MNRPPHPALRRPGRTPRAAAARRGFTLVELLTVISIMCILMSILVPTVGMIQLKAREAKSSNNLRSLGKALMAYSLDHSQLLPAPIYAQSGIPGNARNSANPTAATWLEELMSGNYIEGTYKHVAGSGEIEVIIWPPVLTDPQYLALHASFADEHVRGYGMNTKPYLADKDSPDRNKDFSTQRQKMDLLPNHSNNVVLGTSNAVTMEPDLDGRFPRAGNGYTNGDPARYRDEGLFLFLDDSVSALSEKELAKILSDPNT